MKLWTRYKDDKIVIINSNIKPEDLLSTLDKTDINIKFTIELESTNIEKDKKLKMTVYGKNELEHYHNIEISLNTTTVQSIIHKLIYI